MRDNHLINRFGPRASPQMVLGDARARSSPTIWQKARLAGITNAI
ncbi:hypothetical protein THTE_2655 [Thermogutta terrifontis]|uniref:Uncharacterized protein n=1 Tax=Thermogutta terrifontis TaxID=1331910 RepID=A0A286RH23_9BACT|nr:hypothetical protein THTE_2655 [Thermogutta terrifontis]